MQRNPPIDPWFDGFAVIPRANNLVVGTVTFKGPPADGMVEIAYGIAPSWQNTGLATEAAGAITAAALATPPVTVVRAHTLAQPNASTRVLTKIGFKHLGEGIDPEDGLVWRWEKDAGSGSRQRD